MSDLVVQIIRTLAQTAAGAIITWLATNGYDVDSEALVGLLFMVISAAWAAATTWLSVNVHPVFGWLSIVPAAPAYNGDA